MITYNQRKDQFTKGDKKIAAADPEAEPTMIQYICDEIRSGKTLEEIVPKGASKVWQPAGQLIELIDASYDYRSKVFRAEATRAKLLKERLFSSAARVEANPTKENLERLTTLKKTLDAIDDDKFHTEPISIEFNVVHPENFWETGENPYERADENKHK